MIIYSKPLQHYVNYAVKKSLFLFERELKVHINMTIDKFLGIISAN